MQNQHDPAGEEAILSPERAFRARLLVDWNQDGAYSHSLSDLGHYVERASVDRNLTGSAPSEVLLVEGSAAAELSVTLHGEVSTMPLPAIFSPYNSRSPLYGNPMVGAEVRYEIGVESPLGTLWYPQFIGNVRTITPNRADNHVELSALDRAEHMRRPIKFPPWAISEKHEQVNHSYVAQLCNTAWVIDHCLRQCDTSPTPYRPTYRADINNQAWSPDGTQVWVSGTGSWLPTVGWSAQRDKLTLPNVDDTALVMYERFGTPHPDAPLHMNGESHRPYNIASLGASPGEFAYWGNDRDALAERGVHHIAFTALLDGQNNAYWQTTDNVTIAEIFVGGRVGIRVKNYSGAIFAQVMRTTGDNAVLTQTEQVSTDSVHLPAEGSWCRIHIAVDMTDATGGVSAHLLATGDNYSEETTLHQIRTTSWWPTSVGNHAYKGYVRLFTKLAVNDFCYATRDQGAGLALGNNAGVPARFAATLDPGLQNLTHLPVRNGEDSWQIVTDVASAEFGSAFWDETGVFRYWNYETMLARQNQVVREYTLDDLSQLQITNTFDSVRNIWSADMSKSVGIEGTVYAAGSLTEFYMPADGYYQNDTHKVRVWSDQIVAAEPTFLPKCTTYPTYTTVKEWGEGVTHGYVPTFFKGNFHTGDYTTVERWEEDAGLHSQVAVNAFYDASGSLVVQVWNSNPYPMRLATSTVKWNTDQITDAEGDVIGEEHLPDYSEPVDPQPACRIGGTVVNSLGNQIDTVDSNASRESVRLYGGRNLRLSGDWIQYGYDANKAAEVLQPRMLKPSPTTDAITVAGDPRVQLGDLIMVRDTEGFGDNIKLQVYGISREFSLDAGLVDTLTVEMIQPIPLDLDPENPVPTVTRYNLCPDPTAQKLNTGGNPWYGPTGSQPVAVSEMPRDLGLFIANDTGGVVGPRTDIVEGELYRFSVYVKGTHGACSGVAQIHWRKEPDPVSGDDWNGASPQIAWSVTSGGIVRIDTGAVIAPQGTVRGHLYMSGQTAAYTLTAALYERTEYLRDYFDGDTPGAQWLLDGTSTMLAEGEEPTPGSDATSAAARYGWGAIDPSSDEFDGTEVDIDRWGVYGRGGDVQPDGTTGSPITNCWPGHDGNGRRCADTVTLENGFLRITGYEDGDTGGISHRFNQRYGRWEIRARMHKEPGTIGDPYHMVFIIWPESERWPEDGEYDFVEIENAAQGKVVTYQHYPHPDNVPVQQEYAEKPGVDLSGWHNYGFEWSPDGVVGYLDGDEWFRFSGGGGPNGRGDIQDMPSGHLTIQVDNFNDGDEPQNEKSYLDIAWARVYPLRALNPPFEGPDGSLEPPQP